MKKIVGILAAAAVATSVFAADVSAATKIGGKLFSYESEHTDSTTHALVPTTIGVFTENNESHDYANPNISFSISSDKAGAAVKLTTDGKTKTVSMTTQTIWFKPIDALKLTAGTFDVALNKETICYTESITGLGGNGLLVSVNVEGFGLDLGLAANEAFWLTKKDGTSDPEIKNFFAKAAYSADFGTIGGYIAFNKTYNPWEYFNNFVVDTKAGAINNMMFGAGYANNFNGINMFVNVVGYMGNKFDWIRPEAFVSGSVEDFGFAAFVAPLIWVNSDLNKKAELEVVAKLSYKIESVTAYAQFQDTNILADKFASTIKVGASGSCGAMGWNIWAQIDTGKGDAKDKLDFSVPFELTIAF